MKPDDELRRLRRLIVIVSMVATAFICGLVLWASVQVKNLKSQVIGLSSAKVQVIRGIDGKDGVTTYKTITVTVPGKDGANGKDGQNATSDQIAAAVAAYLRLNPVVGLPGIKGDPGSPGNNGRTLQIRVDYTTCQLEEKYIDDDSWTPVAQLSSPCNINSQNEPS